MSRSSNTIPFCERNSFVFWQNIQPGWVKTITFLTITSPYERLVRYFPHIHFGTKVSTEPPTKANAI